MDFNKIFDEIEDLKNEIIQSRGLTIKTDNLVQNLNHEVKNLINQHNDHVKQKVLHTFFVYLIIVGLSFLCSYFLFSSKLKNLESKYSDITQNGDKNKQDINKVSEELETIKKDIVIILKVKEDLDSESNKEEVIKNYETLTSGNLGVLAKNLLEDRVLKIKKDLGHTYLEKGRLFFDKNDFSNAEKNLNMAKNYLTDLEDLALLNFYRAKSLSGLKKFDESIAVCKHFFGNFQNHKLYDDMLFLIANNYEELNDKDNATRYYEDLIKNFSRSPLAQLARNKFEKKEVQNPVAPVVTTENNAKPSPAIVPQKISVKATPNNSSEKKEVKKQ